MGIGLEVQLGPLVSTLSGLTAKGEHRAFTAPETRPHS